MTLQQLMYFCTVAETLSYTKASKILHFAQPSLSLAISKLEKELGIPLFEKHGRTLRMTKLGETFLPYAQKALETLHTGTEKLRFMISPGGGTINVGYNFSVSFNILPALISQFLGHSENKEISFQFFQGVKVDIVQRLRDGKLDVAIAGPYNDPFLCRVPLFRQDFFLVVPTVHPLASKKTVSLKELQGENFIIPTQDSGLRESLDKIFKKAGYEPKIAVEVDECNSMVAFVQSGQGITILPWIPLLNDPNLTQLNITDFPINREISLLWVKDRYLTPSAERFKNFAIKQKLQANVNGVNGLAYIPRFSVQDDKISD